jgi:hypothetical protein
MPLFPDDTVIQSTSLVAVHEQVDALVTVTLIEPPAVLTVCDVRDSVAVQVAVVSDCVTV